jgi:hypothetical protein
MRLVLLLGLSGLTACFTSLDERQLTHGSGSSTGSDMTRPRDMASLADMAGSSCETFLDDAVGAVPAGWTVQGGSWSVIAVGAMHALAQQTAHATDPQSIVNAAPNDVQVTATLLAGSSAGKNCVQARFVDTRNHYSFCIAGGTSFTLYRDKGGTVTELSGGPLNYDPGARHQIALAVKGSALTAQLDGTTLGVAHDTTFGKGSIALAADGPSSFSPVCVQPL